MSSPYDKEFTRINNVPAAQNFNQTSTQNHSSKLIRRKPAENDHRQMSSHHGVHHHQQNPGHAGISILTYLD